MFPVEYRLHGWDNKFIILRLLLWYLVVFTQVFKFQLFFFLIVITVELLAVRQVDTYLTFAHL